MSTTANPMLALRLLSFARHATESGEAKTIREQARLSQGELARALGISAACLSRWEAGLRQPSGEHGVRYGEVLADLQDLTSAYGGHQDALPRAELAA